MDPQIQNIFNIIGGGCQNPNQNQQLWAMDPSYLDDLNSVQAIDLNGPPLCSTSTSDLPAAVCFKHEKYVFCYDCGQNFVSKKKFNDHMRECAPGKINHGVDSPPPTKGSQPAAPSNSDLTAGPGTGPESESETFPSSNPNSVTYTMEPSLLQSAMPGSLSPSYFTPTFEVLYDHDHPADNNNYESTSTLTSKWNSSNSNPTHVKKMKIPRSTVSSKTLAKSKPKYLAGNAPSTYIDAKGNIAIAELYECPTCKKRYRSKYGYILHSRTHTGEKRHKCDVCQAAFNQSVHLKDHMRTHTGEKPYHCAVCGKNFAQSQNLKHHSRVHEGIGPHQCSLLNCDKNFFTKKELKAHLADHTGNRHVKEGLALLTPDKSQSQKTHMSLKLYTCEFCGSNFKTKGSLGLHVKYHNVPVKDRGPIERKQETLQLGV